MADGGAERDRLLAAAVDHVAAHGASDSSLRGLAEALGTSHRMLIYHFGSKDGLLAEVVRAAERRQRAVLAALDPAPGASLAEDGWRWWAAVSDPELWPLERLFFELYGQALQGRRYATAMLDGVVESWLAPVTALLARHGVPEPRVEARLAVAVTRGLLLDLLATGDRDGVDAAARLFMARYTAAAPAG